jgi:death-on-curing protein
MAPQVGYYATLAELTAVYVHGVARNHGYVDGNKRTAVTVLLMFLGANGFPAVLNDKWPDIIEGVADGSITRDALIDFIVTRLMGGNDVVIEHVVRA